ncbi:Alb1 domain-containing protein [Aspergillus luchuensis]|uniref:Similar to An14g05140 n=1 Tax=Aspergillus kawachii TaxID=1069201 RepID=A0A146EZ24_ASPKA|nr:uncharacterized protein AKAW2_41155A [Aspergillus luchuensis]BCR99472.1 hypothetical protein AKAW2_41155A [Aspergillus luchuensis]BCS11772.1 hypothetical protein ALUC_41112A [Aspergillus luchuensis]GAA90715.1 similar to An14g05140 [Aspergillus luchuensis IFO 4308]GAT19277.1 similar to An14g05140 [Aspergillus luchuensis]
MAKSRPQSKHSRAARRAASPSLDVDKSITSLPRAEETTVQRDSILSERANAGVSKKASKGKAKTRAQRLRQQKGVERAEAVMDQLEKKVVKSESRAKSVKARRAEWEDLNRKTKSMFEALNEADDNMDDAMMDDAAASKPAKRSKPAPVTQAPVVEEHEGIDVDDDIT